MAAGVRAKRAGSDSGGRTPHELDDRGIARIGTSAKKDPVYSVILPVYEERENLPLCISMIAKAFKEVEGGWEVIVVEDNSPDGTRDVAHELRRVYGKEHIGIVERPGKMGLGTAYVDALSTSRGEFVFLMDADLSHHPKFIPEFIAKMEETDADVVTGTRYIPGGGVHGWDFRRKLTSRVANFLAHTLLAPGASDLTGSFRLYKRDVLATVMESVVSKGYVFQMEVIARAAKSGYHIEEVPITFVDRIYGDSKLGAGQIVGYLQGLIQLFFEF